MERRNEASVDNNAQNLPTRTCDGSRETDIIAQGAWAPDTHRILLETLKRQPKNNHRNDPCRQSTAAPAYAGPNRRVAGEAGRHPLADLAGGKQETLGGELVPVDWLEIVDQARGLLAELRQEALL